MRSTRDLARHTQVMARDVTTCRERGFLGQEREMLINQARIVFSSVRASTKCCDRIDIGNAPTFQSRGALTSRSLGL